ncbi:hypothetical protein K7I13_15010 [Brucepastera parasyntrophica]|uniref:hypothetical protein n=1 Tax=Brucepastera parasyntrophica TaxID=2880008 RepID=UPI00210E8E6A|nr:hypothetical protein [Brucepastera parasyntrophica]ULQ59741.1 hypothetical protein K7I13_15010 [Brucepastera parasyntrophica]
MVEFGAADYFLGFLPTAVKVSFEFNAKLMTSHITVNNSGQSMKTDYSYDMARFGPQWMITRTTISNGLIRIRENYSVSSKMYWKYFSFDDGLVAVLREGLHTEDPMWERLYFALMTERTITDLSTGTEYEKTVQVWNEEQKRPSYITVTRGSAMEKRTHYTYDDWGNITKDQTSYWTPQETTSITTESWYYDTGSIRPSGIPSGIPGTPGQSEKGTRNLLLGSKKQ